MRMLSSGTHYADKVFRDIRLECSEVASCEFRDCTFFRCLLIECVFRRCRFVNCLFRECDLSLIKLPESRFTSTRFESSKVIGVNWTQAQWPKAGLANPVSFFKCALSHSTFIGLSLPSMQVRDCVATDVDFREADLSEADFGGTDLSNSIFGQTNLSQADLSRARNYRIDPGQNMLKRARFSLPEAMSLLHSMDIVLIDQD